MLDDIAFFIALLETKSFTKTAERLNITASTLSRHIKDLEDKLGQQLIVRTSKTFEITPFGEYLYKKAKHIPDYLSSILDNYGLQDQVTESKCTINLALGAAISSKMILPKLDRFFLRHPNINLNISLMSNISEWPAKHINIVLSPVAIKGSNLVNRFIRTEHIQLYASVSYASIHGVPENIEDLANHKVIGMVDDRLKPMNYVNMYNINSRKEYLLNLEENFLNINNAVHQLEAGIHFNALFSSFDSVVHEHVRSGKIIKVLPNWALYELNFHIVSRKSITKEEQSIITFMSECLSLS
jgi:LysR family transcriptional regulator for bpeEF and oprC